MKINADRTIENPYAIKMVRCPFDERGVAILDDNRHYMIDTLTNAAMRITRGAFEHCRDAWLQYESAMRMVYDKRK